MVRWEAGFCGGGEFWNSQKTWYTSYPSFTKCFEWTVLTYVGAALLWVAAALSVLRRERALPKQIPLTFLGFWKTGNVSILAACYLWLAVRDATQPPDKMAIAGILCSMIKCVSCLIILVLHCTRRKGIIIPRTTLWTYWLIETVMSSPRVYRVLVAAPSLMAEEELTESRTLIMATYSLTMISFILECFTDSGSLEQDKGVSNPSPLLSASPLSAIFFEWMTSFIFKGYKRDITEEDLFDPPSHLKTQANFETWKVLWNRELKRAKFNPVNGSFDWKRAPSLFRTLRVMFWPNFLLLLVMIFVRSLVRVSVALVLHLMMNFMGDNSQPVWQGVFCSLTLFSLTLIASRALRYSEYLMAIVGIRIRGILMTAIYQKALRISSNSRGRYTIGEIVNLASIDADKVFRLCTATTMVVVAPLTILLSTTLIWHYLGASCLAGIAVILLIIPISGFLASKNRRMHEKLMALKDCRLEAMHEIINSIKILKLFAWEPPFMARVESVRDKEASLLNVFVYMLATTEFIYTCTPFLVGLMSFMTFVLVSPDNVLTPAVAFVTLTLFNQIRLSMVVIPDFISSCAQTIVALRRIREFLMSEEKDPGLIGRSPSEGNVITMQNVTVSWDDGGLAPVLSRVSLSARRGKLLAIVGPLGSGKSSLLSSILGDMTLTEGRIDVAGSIAYAAQTAWIQNQTIRDNIMFTSKFDRRKYERVLDACCLRADLSVLPEGDATEIGEKGINLSGGQKQRVALARAVYQDKEIYLFDDPLSALDAHVGKSVFKSVIGPEGMLREKTRVLVTNDPSVMQNADYIVILKDGRISEEGTYADLINSRGSLANLLKILGIEESASDSPDAKTRDGNRSRSQDDETALIESIVEGAAQSRTKKNVSVEKEKVETGAVKWDVYKNFLKHMGFTLPLLGILSHLASQALDVVVGLWLSAWTEDRDLSIWNRNRRLSIYAVLGISQAVMNFCGVALLTKAIINAATKLHRVILGSLMRAPLTFFDLTPSGRILNRFGRDLNQLDTELPITVKFMLEMVLRIIGVVGLISIKIPSFLVAAFAFIVLFVVLRRISVRTLRQVKRLESVTRSPVYSHFSETIQGLSSIRGFGVGRVFEKIHEAKLDVAQNCSFHGTTTHHWLYSRLELLGNIMILIMFILCVINREHFDAGTAGLLISYSLSSMYAFNFVIHYSSELEATIVAAERLDEYARVTPEAEWTSKDPPEDDWPSAGAITFENYSARYRAGLELILRGVNLTVASRQKIGVVGRTGAGKSSLISTLFRIIEAETGRIVIDRRDISKIGLHELRSRLTIIPQEPVLFDATLRFNLDPTNEYTDETLWRALESTHLGRFFKNLMGLDTQIAECGSNLSAGQRQLVCLARAVLRKRRILVLDEATASVDLETDVLIQETIRSAFGDSTIITIAHRINTILDSDVVVVMSRGNIAEIGPPEDLLKDARSEFAVMAREAGISVNHKSTTD